MAEIWQAPGSPLLATKLFVPRPRADLVARPRLLGRLHAGLAEGRCTLLSAPAGAGKTSLLAAWTAELDRPVAWLALDERDQDVHQVLRYLLTAIGAIDPSSSRSAWFDGPLPPAEVVVTEMINSLAVLSTPGLLVLDDYHVVRSTAVHSAVAFLVDHLPPALHLAIASREDPPLPLPRMRVRNQLVELRAADLGFTLDEAGSFLGGSMGLELTDPQVEALFERTEGWAAGLQMAGLALRDRPDPGEFVNAFAGGHRLVADYLAAEVLQRQDPRTRRFLVATALLDRMCAPLCDAVLGDDGPADDRDSRLILEELERANLFLVPLDGDRNWFRYHHLFADALRALLARETSAGAAVELHRRASAWFGAQGLLPEAIQHALAAGAVADAANWIEDLAPVMFGSTDIYHDMETGIAQLPEALVRSRPVLCLARAWLLIHHLEVGQAAAWAEAAERALPADHGSGRQPLRGGVLAVRSLLATLGATASPELACELAEQALLDLQDGDVAFRGVAGVALGQAALALGRPDRSEQVLAVATEEGRASGLLHSALVVASHLVCVQRLRGGRRRAAASGRKALAWAAERGNPAAGGRGVVSTLLAEMMIEGNDVAGARPLMVEGHRVLTMFRDRPPLMLFASLGLARLHLAEGDPAAAATAVAEMRRLLQQGPYAAMAPIVEAREAEVQLALGNAAAAVAWATSADQLPLPAVFRLQTHIFAAGVQALLVTPAQILVGHGRATGDAALLRHAARGLSRAAEVADRQHLGWLGLRVSILQALVADGLGDHHGAHATVDAAIAEAEPEGVIRPFLDAGEPMSALLTAVRSRKKHRTPEQLPSAAFLDALLDAFPAGSTAAPQRSPGAGPALTSRELDVLRLLAAGRSNAGMAHTLVVGQSTVKTHLVNLYDKLGVHSRTQAVARARALGLVD